MAFWYNVSTGQVESDENRSQGETVLGPYDTMEEAGRALQTAAEKTKAWDAAEKAWESKGAAPGWDDDAES